MSEGWQRLPVDGGGVQSVNARFMQKRRRLSVFYGLLVLSPLGLQRLYLGKPLGILGYWSLTAAFFWGLWQGRVDVMALAFGLWLAAVLFEIWQASLWITDYNKKLRQALFLRQEAQAAPPKDYQGRYSDAVLEDYLSAKSKEQAGHGGNEGKVRQAPLSFAEQERLLKQQVQAKRSQKNAAQHSEKKPPETQ